MWKHQFYVKNIGKHIYYQLDQIQRRVNLDLRFKIGKLQILYPSQP